MHPFVEPRQQSTRRAFFADAGFGIGAIGLASLLGERRAEAEVTARGSTRPTHLPAKAKAVIFLFMAGGPSQLELFDDKPLLRELSGQQTPESFLKGRRFAFLKGNETLLGANAKFGRYGQCGAELSDLLPYHRQIADDVCFIKSMKTDVFNHGPAKIFMQTGSPQPGRPSMGSWVTYGIGSESSDLPGFVVLQSGPRGPRGGSALWSSGFVPTNFQGVPFRGQGDPILNLRNPPGYDRAAQKSFTDAVAGLNGLRHEAVGDPEIQTRIAAYEMAYRMQSSAPELMDISAESRQTLALYGAEPGKPSFANNVLLARRLVERGVRFVQLYHTSWDQHGAEQSLEEELPLRCREVDRASAALVLDLKQRGLLDETLVIWGGEFGRTPMGQANKPTGRDHHVDCFTMWLAGGGIRPGITHGQTDELGLGVASQPVHVHDLQATVLHLLGLDHERLTFRFQGRDFRLTDVHGQVVKGILA
ncbi:MAG: sulfatase [Planctomycetota bacterium]|nr:MAG: sulfatase [Planctomycetota bacterium]